MPVAPDDVLIAAFESYVGAQRHLIGLLSEPDASPTAVALVMTSQLDQLGAAVRQSRHGRVSRQRGDPGD